MSGHTYQHGIHRKPGAELLPAGPIRWHKVPGELSTWVAEINGVEIVRASNTSATGTEDYPWEMYAVDDRLQGTGTADTLRSVKQAVAFLVSTYAQSFYEEAAR